MTKTTWVRGAVVIALVALTAALITILGSPRPQPVQADDHVSIEGLTGRALGEELGLEPVNWDDVKGNCWAFASYDMDENGFCLDSVVSSKLEAALMGRQINGHLLSDQEREYVELTQDLANLMDSDEATQEQIEELSTRVWEMKKSLYPEE